MSSSPSTASELHPERQVTMHVVHHVRALIENRTLRPGDKIPPEREFSRQLGISRASLRAGLGYLAAMGVLRIRHGIGAFVAEAPSEFGAASLPFLSALPGFQDWQLFEARRVLECELAALAADRATEHHHTLLAEEVAEMYATVDSPQEYLIHDIRFHRTIAEASGNPILASLMGSISRALYESRRDRVALTSDLRASTDHHRELFRAIRARDANTARDAMGRHLRQAESFQKLERLRAVPHQPASHGSAAIPLR